MYKNLHVTGFTYNNLCTSSSLELLKSLLGNTRWLACSSCFFPGLSSLRLAHAHGPVINLLLPAEQDKTEDMKLVLDCRCTGLTSRLEIRADGKFFWGKINLPCLNCYFPFVSPCFFVAPSDVTCINECFDGKWTFSAKISLFALLVVQFAKINVRVVFRIGSYILWKRVVSMGLHGF